jgi:hypothetical protein
VLMNKHFVLGVTALLLLAGSSAFATSTCPVMTGGNAGGGEGVSADYIAHSGVTDGGCNILITFSAGGSINTTFPNTAISYDVGADDNLVGVINNTAMSLTSFSLTGHSVLDSGGTPSATFGFEDDGACDSTWAFLDGNPCGTATSGYLPQGVSVTNISADKLTAMLNFVGGIAPNGGTAWFSLEGPADKNLLVNNLPEPGTFAALGLGLACITLVKKRRSNRT